MQLRRLARTDLIQKTWIPEGTQEYTYFKATTRENDALVNVMKDHLKIGPNDLVLDVGGRDGSVALALQDPIRIHIVDPDPNIEPLNHSVKFWRNRVEYVAFDPNVRYKIIICCHVLGYLGGPTRQQNVVKRLTSMLEPGGALVLFYNTNVGYMNELLEY
jgi:hypothetical protein